MKINHYEIDWGFFMFFSKIRAGLYDIFDHRLRYAHPRLCRLSPTDFLYVFR